MYLCEGKESSQRDLPQLDILKKGDNMKKSAVVFFSFFIVCSIVLLVGSKPAMILKILCLMSS